MIRNSSTDLGLGGLGEGSGDRPWEQEVPAGGEFYPDGTLNGALVFRLLQRGDDDQLIVLAEDGSPDPRVSFPGGTPTAVLFGTHQPRFGVPRSG
jgi:hypothetical protein